MSRIRDGWIAFLAAAAAAGSLFAIAILFAPLLASGVYSQLGVDEGWSGNLLKSAIFILANRSKISGLTFFTSVCLGLFVATVLGKDVTRRFAWKPFVVWLVVLGLLPLAGGLGIYFSVFAPSEDVVK